MKHFQLFSFDELGILECHPNKFSLKSKMAAKMATSEANETKLSLRCKLPQWSMFDNFPLMRNIKMSQKLIFMKIKDGRYMNPMGHDLILGPPKFLN